MSVAFALTGLLVFAPPELPPDIGDLPADGNEGESPPAEDDAAPPSDQSGAPEEVEPPAEGDDSIPVAPEDPPDDDNDDDVAEAGEDAAGGAAAGGAADPGTTAGDVAADSGTAADGVADSGESAAEAGGSGAGAGAGGGAGGGGAGPAVQKPGGATPGPQKPQGGARAKPGTPPPPPPAASPTEGPSEVAPSTEAEAEAEAEPEEEEEEEETYKKLGGFRLFRIGLAAKIGYTHGTSSKNGLYDRQKSIDDSLESMMLMTSGAGDLGKTKFGGFQYGFILDAEVVGINVWLDFHKFFRPGGMWSLLLGYDHEFGFGKRLRLDVGVAGGLNQVFLGSVLKGLYYDQDNPEAVNIGTLGVEGRAMVDLHIKLVGPLYTGPYAMLGYHYLWSASVEEVTAEKGLHYSLGWTLRLDFAAPKLIGGRKTKNSKPAPE